MKIVARLSLIAIYWRDMNKAILKRGMILGSWLCLAMLTVTVSLNFSLATSTAFFPSLGGVTAAIITGIFLKRPIAKTVWVAGSFSLLGISIIVASSGGGFELRGNLIAFLGALFFTAYIFLVDYDRQKNSDETNEHTFWLVLGVEHLVIVIWMAFITILFGDWQSFHPILPRDAEVILYIGGATTFVPVVLSTFMQRYIDPLEVAFISTLEPVWGVIIAYLYLHETTSSLVYVGGTAVVAGSIFYTWSTSDIFPSQRRRNVSRPGNHPFAISVRFSIISSMIILAGGVFLLYWLGGFPPIAWFGLLHTWPHYHALIVQGQGMYVLKLCLQSLCWLIAWGALIIMGILTAITSARRILEEAQERVATQELMITRLPEPEKSAIPQEQPLMSRRTTRSLSPVAQRRLASRGKRLGLP